MLLEGKVWKSKKSRFWIIEIEPLDLVTQGTSKKDALQMIKFAIEDLVNEKSFKVTVYLRKNGDFAIGANDEKLWLAFFFQRLRMKEGLTLEQVARKLGYSSITSYARYEQGKVDPSVTKFNEILGVLSPKKKPVFKFAA